MKLLKSFMKENYPPKIVGIEGDFDVKKPKIFDFSFINVEA